ncbi:hypothetical protein D3C78_1605220 [compost metagenome]
MRVANFSALHKLAYTSEVMVEAAVKAYLQLYAGGLHSVKRLDRLGDIHADWLFAENMLACSGCGLDQRNMRIGR